MKKIKKINAKLVSLLLFTLPSFVFGASLADIVKEIDNWIQNSFVKPMLTLVIIAIFIYMAKNHDRIKEIWVMCIIILIAVIGIMNAGNIAEWISNTTSN